MSGWERLKNACVANEFTEVLKLPHGVLIKTGFRGGCTSANSCAVVYIVDGQLRCVDGELRCYCPLCELERRADEVQPTMEKA